MTGRRLAVAAVRAWQRRRRRAVADWALAIGAWAHFLLLPDDAHPVPVVLLAVLLVYAVDAQFGPPSIVVVARRWRRRVNRWAYGVSLEAADPRDQGSEEHPRDH